MKAPISINEIMTKEIISIDIKKTVQEALDLMQDHSLRKLIVTVENQPRYILEDWKALTLQKNKPLEYYENMLRRVEKVQSGTMLEEVRIQLEKEPAILVTQDEQMIGIVTATDLTKLIGSKRQFKIR